MRFVALKKEKSFQNILINYGGYKEVLDSLKNIKESKFYYIYNYKLKTKVFNLLNRIKNL